MEEARPAADCRQMGAGAEGRGRRRPAGGAGMSETWSQPREAGVLEEKTNQGDRSRAGGCWVFGRMANRARKSGLTVNQDTKRKSRANIGWGTWCVVEDTSREED